MSRPYSLDLRERVVAAVEKGGISRRQAAAQFARRLGSAVPQDRQCCTGQDGRPQAEGDRRRAPHLAFAADRWERLHHPRARRRVRRAWPEGRLSVGVELPPCRETELQKKLSSPASAIAPTSHASERSGKSIRAASSLSVWSSSTRPGPRPTWHRCGDGRPAVRGSPPKSRTAAGRRRPFWLPYATAGLTPHGFSTVRSTARPSEFMSRRSSSPP